MHQETDLDNVHAHLSEAMLALTRVVYDSDDVSRAKLIEVARQ